MIAYLKAETLPREEESRLIAAAQAGDMEARNRVILANMPFMRWWATRQRRPTWMDLSDVVAVGVVGMIRAIGKWRPGPGRFTYYAKHWMRKELEQAENKGQLVRIPLSALYQAKIGGLKERTARAVLFLSGGMKVLSPAAFEEMSQRWWSERYPQEVSCEHS